MLKKLRIKFICVIMAIVTAMLCVVFGLVYHFTRQNLEQQSLQMMSRVAEGSFRMGQPKEQENLVQLPYFILYIDHNGNILSFDGGYYDLSDAEFVEKLASMALLSASQTGVLEEYALRFSRASSPMGISIVFADTSSERAVLNNLVTTCIFIGILCLLVFFGISFLLARWTVKPVEEAWAQQRQFVADASHELKTPLTVILTNAELLQETDIPEPSRQQFAGSILTMSHQMRGLVESLLELARVDNGTLQTHFVPLNFSELVTDAVLPFEPLYFEQGMELALQIEENITLNGSESHLRQVVEILLDNARKYSYPNATVLVRLEKQAAHCLLTVTNPGEPIAKEDLERIFKRFYRADKARSMNHSYGLGLPIAQGIVNNHRGKIWADSARGLNTFHVLLPCGIHRKEMTESKSAETREQ